MAQNPCLKFSVVAEYFIENTKALKRGENAFKSGHVRKVVYNPEFTPAELNGTVDASMKDKSYEVRVSFMDDGILNASCTCPRGQVLCHHMAALCIYAYHNISATDKPCQWSVRKPNMDSVKTCKELHPCRPGYKATSRQLTTTDVENLRSALSSLSSSGPFVGYSWLLSPHNVNSNSLVVAIEDVLYSKEYLESPNRVELFLQKCHIDVEKIKLIADTTKHQSRSEHWLIYRKNRLTASRFGLVLAACQRDRYPPSLFKNLSEGYDLDRVKAVQWGRDNEKMGLQLFTDTTGLDVTPTGLWLDPCGFLGASPDGFVGEENLVEVKCPFKYRQKNLQEVFKEDKSYIVYLGDDDSLIINKKHSYYHQIQGQLYITQKSKCFLVIWTPNSGLIVEVFKDDSWAGNIAVLKNFYLNRYIKYISGETT